jgi:hypothetical protein
MMIALVALTLAGFVVVSKLLSPKSTDGDNRADVSIPASGAPQTSPSVSSWSGNKSRMSAKEMAAALGEEQQLLEKMTEAVSRSDWTMAGNLFSDFQSKARRLPPPQLHFPDLSPLLQDFYDLHEVRLERALAEQDGRGAALALNQLDGIIGEHRARLEKSSVALELQRLRFLARELELWSEAGDGRMMDVRAAALRAAWQDARPVLIARRNADQAVRNFDQLIERLALARQSRELAALIPEFKKQLAQIEQTLQTAQRLNSADKNNDGVADDDQ